MEEGAVKRDMSSLYCTSFMAHAHWEGTKEFSTLWCVCHAMLCTKCYLMASGF